MKRNIFFLVLLLAFLGVTLLFIKERQDIRNRAAGSNEVDLLFSPSGGAKAPGETFDIQIMLHKSADRSILLSGAEAVVNIGTGMTINSASCQAPFNGLPFVNINGQNVTFLCGIALGTQPVNLVSDIAFATLNVTIDDNAPIGSVVPVTFTTTRATEAGLPGQAPDVSTAGQNGSFTVEVNAPSIYFSPETNAVISGSAGNIYNIYIDSNTTYPVTAAVVEVAFDISKVRVTNIEPGADLPEDPCVPSPYCEKIIDNTTGIAQIQVATGLSNPPITEKGHAVKITFDSIGNGSSVISFTNNTQIAAQGHTGNVVGEKRPGTITTDVPTPTSGPSVTPEKSPTLTPPLISVTPSLTVTPNPQLSATPTPTPEKSGTPTPTTVSQPTNTSAPTLTGVPSITPTPPKGCYYETINCFVAPCPTAQLICPSPTVTSAGPTSTPPPVASDYTVDIGDKQSLTIVIGGGAVTPTIDPNTPQMTFKAKLALTETNPDMYFKLRVKDELAFTDTPGSTGPTCENPGTGGLDIYVPVRASAGVYVPVPSIATAPPAGAVVAQVSSTGWVALPGITPNRFYSLILKGEKTRGTLMGEHVRLQSGQPAGQNLDWTFRPMEPGDLPNPNTSGKQDCAVNSIDLSLIIDRIAQVDSADLSIADVNYDGVVNSADLSKVVNTLSIKPDDDL